MKCVLTAALAAGLLCASFPAAAQSARDDARPKDLQRLQEDADNLDGELQALEPGDSRGEQFRRRAEEIREDTIYLKVKMRRHQRAGQEGTGVSYGEVADLRRAIADLRDDLERSFGSERRHAARLPEGTRLLLRLDEPLSSKTARLEDRFDASVYRPVRSDNRLTLPAGSRVRGIVRAVEPAQRPSKAGHLELDFDTLYLDRTRLDLRARVVSIEEDDRGSDTAGKAGIGAVVGGVLGGLLGGKKGAIAGILIGGTGAVVATKGDDVELPAGTVVTVELTRPLVVPRD